MELVNAHLETALSPAFFFGLRPKKTQGEKTQEFKNSRKKLKLKPNKKKSGII